MKKLLSKALAFIYAGENERPVNSVNFRCKSKWGLGLINPIVKAKALLIKTIYRDFLRYDFSINDDWIVNSLYGYNEFPLAPMRDLAPRSAHVFFQQKNN